MLLHQKLLELQWAHRYSNSQMALLIGIPRTTYNAIKIKRNGISHANAIRIVKAFPELEPYALEDAPTQSSEERAVSLLSRLGYTVVRRGS